MSKPLFIPLNAKHFNRFAEGGKREEFRLAGGRWNTSTCWPGRSVVLSYGYGKQRRLLARIKAVRLVFSHLLPPADCEALRQIYGPGNHRILAIELDEIRPAPKENQKKTRGDIFI
jgi:hypothetical protein